MLVFALICLFYSFLMLKWFFIEGAMRKSLPLAFLSHHPVTLLYLIYLGVTFQEVSGQSFFHYFWFVFPVGMAATNWEMSRKLKEPHEENLYTTYSKIWGPKRTSVFCLLVQTCILTGFLYYFDQIDSPLYFKVLFLLFFVGVIMLPYVYFIKTLKQKWRLKKVAENLSLFSQLFLIISFYLKG